MEFLYHNARLPGNTELLCRIDAAARRLRDKLAAVRVADLEISDYNKRYLGEHLGSLRSTLQKYSYLLAWALHGSDLPWSRFVFVEYGGGAGILSLLARELGIGTVIYNDIYDVSCADARTVARSLSLEADHYVQGDVDAVVEFLRANRISCNAVASYDVIEHVYDIEAFFAKLAELSDGEFTMTMGSGANTHNPLLRRRFMKQHIEIEQRDRATDWGHKERDCPRAYLAVRREIVAKHAPSIAGDELEMLARATRGLIEPEIHATVDAYRETGVAPEPPAHPTNTCDPYTGNWAEHLMDADDLERLLADLGLEVDVLSGYYGHSDRWAKRFVVHRLNGLISVLRGRGLPLAPFYTVYARKHLQAATTV